MNTTNYSIHPHLLLILFIAVLFGLTGCATSTSHKPDDIDKKELAMRLQNCISFIGAANEHAKSRHDKKAQEMFNKAQHLSLDAKDDFTHEKYKDALNKVNAAYRLGLDALAILKKDLPPNAEEQQQQLQQEAESRLQVNKAYINAVKRTFGYATTETAEADFEVATKDREKALNDYNVARYQEAIKCANRSTDRLILILTELEYIEHGKVQKRLNVDQLMNEGKKEQQMLQSIQLK